MNKRNLKLTVVGTGMIGTNLALLAAEKKLFDTVVLLDRKPEKEGEDKVAGAILDLKHAAGFTNSPVNFVAAYSDDYEPVRNSDFVVITAGVMRKPGQERSETLGINAKIVGGIVKEITKVAPNATIVMISNPLDNMVYLADQIIKQADTHNKVIGMAGVLDTTRFRTQLAEAARGECTVADVEAMIVGPHNPSMLVLPQYTTIWGTPAKEMLNENTWNELVAETGKSGERIVRARGTSANIAPAYGALNIMQAIINNEQKVVVCCMPLHDSDTYRGVANNPYNLFNVATGVPVILGASGATYLPWKLTDEQEQTLRTALEPVRKDNKTMMQLFAAEAVA